ncbi:protein DpdD [Spirillospora sp. NPDC048819]|uniref:protein DpdD n=1 Tax=Spirillospora sp. NPDC048819 TaxID=3155268 RepID=UPI0033FDFCB8
MTTTASVDKFDPSRLAKFLEVFLSEPNDIARYESAVVALREQTRADDDLIVLPRAHMSDDLAYVYVVARRSISTRQVQELIAAFAGASYARTGDRVPYELDLSDPLDKAVSEFIEGETATVFRVSSINNDQKRRELRNALQKMRDLSRKAPTRSWALARPLGRLISDFDAALAAGGSMTSEAIYQQIVNRGGINATNLAHLRIKRFDRLGLSSELLSMPRLSYVLAQNPPRPVKEAVLNAVYTTALAAPLDDGDIDAAVAALSNIRISLPVREGATHCGPEAVAVLLTAAIGRGDAEHLAVMLADLVDSESTTAALPEALLTTARALAPFKAVQPEPPQYTSTSTESSTISPWLDLFESASISEVENVRESEAWRDWESLSDVDGQLSDYLSRLSDSEWSRAWIRVGIILEALDYHSSVPRTARVFIDYALLADRFSPGDLLTLTALADAFFRTGPSQAAYHGLLQELLDTVSRWCSVEQADIALDLVDLLVRMPCPDENARLTLALGILDPIHRHQNRLSTSTHAFARQLSKELDLGLTWQTPDDPEETVQDLSGRTVLLYSLDEGVLKRVAEEIGRQFPDLRVHLSHDKVGSPALKEKAQNSDVIALAVRCAKHAATGFIREHAKSKRAVFYANGSGSSSLLTAAMKGFAQQ